MKPPKITPRQFIREKGRELILLALLWILAIAMRFFPELRPDFLNSVPLLNLVIFALPVLGFIEKWYEFRNRNSDR